MVSYHREKARRERERVAEHAAEIRGKCQSFVGFVEQAWHVLEPRTRFIHGWHIDAICQHLEAVTHGRINRLLMNVPPGSSKALDEDTPVFTTWGWKRHGDLMAGDFVFGPDGEPKRIIAATDPWDEDAFEVRFDNRASITAAGDHLWAVEREFVQPPRWRRDRRPMVVSTSELMTKETVKGTWARADRIPVAEAISLAPRRLLIDPYTLGAWIGDGGSNNGMIYVGDEDIEHLGKVGNLRRTLPPNGTSRKQPFHHVLVDGLQTKLRVLGLLNNKHIPDDYLESSSDQRLALLQGLMDTDGHATLGGECRYTTKLPRLAEQISQLVASLGMKPFMAARHQKSEGRLLGPYYSIGFTAREGLRIFRLPRKQGRVRFATKKRTLSRYVESVTPIGRRRVKCIQVEGGVYLVGKEFIPTHNSLLTSVFWQAWEWGPCGLRDMRYLNTSFNDGPVKRDTRKCRDLILSPWYQALWPEVQLVRHGETSFANSDTGTREGLAFGSLTSQRGDRLVIDDPHSTETAESDVERANTTRKFREGAIDRLNDLEKSAIVIIMQRLHQADISGVIESLPELGFVHLMIPMRFETARRCTTAIGWTDPRKHEGELMDPVRFPAAEVDKLEIGKGPYAFAGQAQQRPAPRKGGMFSVDQFELDGSPGIVEIAPAGGLRVRGWDIAGSTRKTSPYTVGALLNYVNGTYYIEDVKRARAEIDVAENLITSTAKDDKRSRVRQSIPQDPGSAGKSQKLHLSKELDGCDFGFSPETGEKQDRAIPFASQVNSGNVKMVRGVWNAELIDEMRNFPSSTFKDQIDALSRAYMELSRMIKLQANIPVGPILVERR